MDNPYAILERTKKQRNRQLARVAVEAILRWSNNIGVTKWDVDEVLYAVEHRSDHKFRWGNSDGHQVNMSIGVLTLVDREWIAHIHYSFTTGRVSVMIIGDPDPAMEAISDMTDDDMILDALVAEYERLGDRWKRRPIPGKKKPKAKVAPGQTEVGQEQGVPTFGKPETGKRGRKR